MEEQGAVTEEQAPAEKKPAYPRTMTRGPLAGQTFQTATEYQTAMDEAHKNGVPKRARRNNKPKAVVQPVQRKRGGTYRLQADVNGQKIVAEGPVTQAQLIELIRLVAPKS